MLRFKNYYQNKQYFLRYLVAVILIFIVSFQFIWNGNNSVQSEVMNYEIDFAGEDVPFDWEYFINKEKFDREFALTLMDSPQFVMIHKRELLYRDYIEKQLHKNKIPADFFYLVVAESALRNIVYSNAWAGGLWQFMPATAQRYWLRVDSYVDERLDTEKSTQAAIKYIKDLYKIFGNWTMVAAAYNRWENWLIRDMETQHSTKYYNLWLNQETSRYLFRIVAIKKIMESRYQYFSKTVLWSQYQEPKTMKVKLWAETDLALWAKDNWYVYSTIKTLNPRIVWNQLPEWVWEIRVFDSR